MKGVYHGNDYHYRYMPVWSVTFGFLGYISFCLWYREWKRLGGVESFTPPEVGPKPASQK